MKKDRVLRVIDYKMGAGKVGRKKISSSLDEFIKHSKHQTS